MVPTPHRFSREHIGDKPANFYIRPIDPESTAKTPLGLNAGRPHDLGDKLLAVSVSMIGGIVE
jgi:hypothetical protein